MTERIAAALQSSDLSHHERPCDSDTVRALGLAAVHRSLGVLIMEAKEACAGSSYGDAAKIRDLQAAIANIVRKQARRDNLVVNPVTIAALLVREIIMDRCPRCGGRGFLPLAYSQIENDRSQPENDRGVDCPTCFASGRARRDFVERARVAGIDGYSMALKRFYDALEDRLAEAEFNAMTDYYRRFRVE
jgi:hypothetical protein